MHTTVDTAESAARHSTLSVGLVMAASAVAFEAFAVNTAMPAASRDLGGIADYGLVFSVFMLSSFLGVIVGGSVADRGGSANAFVVGALGFSGGLMLAGAADSLLGVAQGRAVQGLGGGVVLSLLFYAVRRAYDETSRPRMISWLATAWVLPGLIGPAVSGLVAEHLGWRWVFWGLAPVMPVAAFLVAASLRVVPASETSAHGGGLAHWSPAALAALVIAIAVLPGSDRIRTFLFATAAVLCLAMFWNMAVKSMFRAHSGVLTVVALNTVVGASYFALEAVLPLSMVVLHNVPMARGGLILAGSAITWTIGTWVQAWFIRRVALRVLLLTGAVAVAVAMSAAAFAVGTPAAPIIAIVVGWAVAAFGMGLTTASISLTVLEQAAESDAGQASATLQLSNMVGGACGAGLAGWLLTAGRQDTVTSTAVLHIALLVAGLGILAVSLCLRPLPEKPANAALH